MRARLRTLLPLVALSGCSNDFKVTAELGQLVVTPVLSDFGALAVGDDATVTLELVAPKADVRVLAVDVYNVEGDWFSLEDEDLPTVTVDTPGALTIRYAPEEEGLHWATVTVSTDEADGAAHEVTVRGEAAEPAARVYPAVLDLGPVRAGTTGEGEIVVVNEGRVPLTLDDVNLSNERFSVDSELPVVVEVGAEVTLDIEYDAVDETEQTGDAVLDLGRWVTVDAVEVRANACSTASGDTYDSDGDGFSFCGEDCDDWDDAVNPAGTETCDGADQDCDGGIDEGTSCVDDDGDGQSEDDGDCNDGDEDVSRAEAEIDANGIDDDCDGMTDDGSVDDDGDGYSASAGDCDDGDASAYPGAIELSDGVDDDCDGIVDDGTRSYDDDGDGVTEDGGDCDDSDAGAAPGLAESADWTDNDCDGDVDEGTSYYDDDGDGFTETGGDCDDANAAANPGEPEVTGNRVDDDCDGVTS